jgi:hypothetical protein
VPAQSESVIGKIVIHVDTTLLTLYTTIELLLKRDSALYENLLFPSCLLELLFGLLQLRGFGRLDLLTLVMLSRSPP